jgi:glycosyltransferase involved in cell wall biosynthesis
MIRVLHLITSLDVGGAQRMLAKLLGGIDRDRFESRVLSLVGGGALAEPIRAAGTPVGELGMRRGWPDPRALRRLRRELLDDPPEVLMTWLYHADILGTLGARLAGLAAPVWNLRCTLHGGSGRGLSSRLGPRICAAMSRAPRMVVTNSREGQRSHEAIGYRPREWRLIPNGFDLDQLRPDRSARREVRRERGLEEGDLLVGMVARWHPMKNHALLLQVAGRMRSRAPRLHFLLVGTGVESSNPAFRVALEAAGDPPRIHPLGERGDLPRLMAGLDFLVSVSTSGEGFPNVLGEALACGVPCITTAVGDSAQIVGEAGEVIAAGSVEETQAAIERLAALSRDERRELGARGRASIEARFRLDRIVEQYEALFRDLASGAPCAD